MGCVYCDQKAQWLQEKLESVRQSAKQVAAITQKMQVIYKSGGTNYEFCNATEAAGRKILEYISVH